MARRKKGEEGHVNHERWAIPYADMLVLLLAFFVVMYSISDVREGEYQAVAASLAAAFQGRPIQIRPPDTAEDAATTIEPPVELEVMFDPIGPAQDRSGLQDGISAAEMEARQRELGEIAGEMREAMSDMIDEDLIEVRDADFYLEVEIKADILFPSGEAEIEDPALPVLERVAEVLEPFDNPIQVEGHTDNVPIGQADFASNWELSAARAGRVVRLFADQGVDPMRLAVVGLGEHRPIASNETPEGRNQNRRVALVIHADASAQERWYQEGGWVDEEREDVEVDPDSVDLEDMDLPEETP